MYMRSVGAAEGGVGACLSRFLFRLFPLQGSCFGLVGQSEDAHHQRCFI